MTISYPLRSLGSIASSTPILYSNFRRTPGFKHTASIAPGISIVVTRNREPLEHAHAFAHQNRRTPNDSRTRLAHAGVCLPGCHATHADNQDVAQGRVRLRVQQAPQCVDVSQRERMQRFSRQTTESRWQGENGGYRRAPIRIGGYGLSGKRSHLLGEEECLPKCVGRRQERERIYAARVTARVGSRVRGNRPDKLIKLSRVQVWRKLETDSQCSIVPKVLCEHVEDRHETGHVVTWRRGTFDVWAAGVELDPNARRCAFGIAELSSKFLDSIEHGREGCG